MDGLGNQNKRRCGIMAHKTEIVCDRCGKEIINPIVMANKIPSTFNVVSNICNIYATPFLIYSAILKPFVLL